MNILKPENISKYTIHSDNMIRGFMLKTAQSIGMMTRNKFMKRYYQLDKVTKVLSVYETSENTCKLKQQYNLKLTQLFVDDELERKLKPGYERELKQQIQLPDQYRIPFAVILDASDVMLFWVQRQADLNEWTSAFKSIMSEQRQQQKKTSEQLLAQITKTSKNAFVLTLFKWL